MTNNELRNKAKYIRIQCIDIITKIRSGHPGASLSLVDVLVVLYYNHMQIDVKNPNWTDRDRFVLSKGHGCIPLYVMLADMGFFDKKELFTIREINSILQGHPDRNKTPGVDASTGSLGMGISIAVGMALQARMEKKDYYIYALLGDGELNEGQVWEAAMAAAHYHLDHLICVIDNNGSQVDGINSEVMNTEPIAQKWRAFNWDVCEINGHDYFEINETFNRIKNVNNAKPHMIIAHTIKGKGVKSIEGGLEIYGDKFTEEMGRKFRNEVIQGD